MDRKFGHLKDNLYTIGVEEEFMLCNHSGDLIDKADTIINNIQHDYRDRFSYELLLSEIESNTNINNTLNESIQEIAKYRNILKDLGKKYDFLLGVSGTHPTAKPHDQNFVKNESYKWVTNQLKYYATQNMTFSIHVHIGLNDTDKLIKITNTLRRWIAPMLALSTNSPFFEGINTGMKSARTFQFGLFPRTEIPSYINSYSDYLDIIENYKKTSSISKPRQIWWKIRPHIEYNTIEFRACDAQRSFDNVKMIVGLVQALVRSIDIKQDYNHDYKYEYLTDSLWKASSRGLNAQIIDPIDSKIISMKDMVLRMVNYCKDSLIYFGNEDILPIVNKIILNGTESDNQIKIFNEKGIKYLKKYLVENVEY